jgi:hypothetical protein
MGWDSGRLVNGRKYPIVENRFYFNRMLSLSPPSLKVVKCFLPQPRTLLLYPDHANTS